MCSAHRADASATMRVVIPSLPAFRVSGGPTAGHLSPLLSSPQAYADTTAHAALSSAFQRPEKANKGLLRMATITF